MALVCLVPCRALVVDMDWSMLHIFLVDHGLSRYRTHYIIIRNTPLLVTMLWMFGSSQVCHKKSIKFLIYPIFLQMMMLTSKHRLGMKYLVTALTLTVLVKIPFATIHTQAQSTTLRLYSTIQTYWWCLGVLPCNKEVQKGIFCGTTLMFYLYATKLNNVKFNRWNFCGRKFLDLWYVLMQQTKVLYTYNYHK